MLSSDPALSICLVVDADTPAWRASLASALTACPSLAHEVVVLGHGRGRVFDLDRTPEGLRTLCYGDATEYATFWQALRRARGRTITLQAEPGVCSRSLPERAYRRLDRHESELVVPRSRALPASRGYWEYGADLAPDLTSTPLRKPTAAWAELPAFKAGCVSFSRARLDHMLDVCGDAWLPDLVPEDLSLRWWLLDGRVVCDTGSTFSRAGSQTAAVTSTLWARERLAIAALHVSDARQARLRRYLEAVVPGATAIAPDPALTAAGEHLRTVRSHDDDWYASRFGFEVFDCLDATVAVGG